METYYKFTKQGLNEIISAFVFKDGHPSEPEQVEFAKDFNAFFKINKFRFDSVALNEDYQKAYNILMEHFDSLPDDVKEDVHEKLNKIGLWLKNVSF